MASNQIGLRGELRAGSLRLNGRVDLAGDDVGVGDHDAGAGDPARAFDAVAAGRAEHAHGRLRGALDVWVARDGAVGR